VSAIAALVESGAALLALRRSVGRSGPSVVRCRSVDAVQRLLERRLVDAVVVAPHPATLVELEHLRARHPALPTIAFAPFRPDDGELLIACRRQGITTILVEGVDDAVVGPIVLRHSVTALRRRALADAPRLLRLTEPLQRRAWEVLVSEVERPVRTLALARRLEVSREHLSRQFGAGGAPNLKRVIDLTRTACAAQLLGNPGVSAAAVVRLLHFTSAGHLNRTALRIAGVPSGELGRIGPAGVLAGFLRGKTRSRR
jgi:AraC-like DNA-binding protein